MGGRHFCLLSHTCFFLWYVIWYIRSRLAFLHTDALVERRREDFVVVVVLSLYFGLLL